MSDNNSLENGQLQTQSDGETSENGSEQSTRPNTGASPLDQITDLIAKEIEDGEGESQGYEGSEGQGTDLQQLQAGDGSDTEGTDAGEPSESSRGKERLKELVEELGTSFEEVYKEMKVPVANGREVTLGELKDAYQDREALVGEVVERREALDNQRAENIKERQIIDQLLPHVAEVPPEVQEQVKQNYETALARETASLHAAMPHLKDSNNFEAFKTDFVEYMGGFGFKAPELTIADHRLIMALNAGMEAQKTLAKLKELKPVQSTPRQRKPSAPSTGQAGPRKPQGREQQIDQIARLLGG